MTFWTWILDNQTKLLGGATVLLSTLVSLAAAGQLDGLIEPVAIKWLGIANVLVGALTGRAGFSNTTKERVAASEATVARAEARTAEAMETAIMTPAPNSTGATRP
jgi:hypothetical protein